MIKSFFLGEFMRALLVKTAVAGCILLLSGCYTATNNPSNATTGGLFSFASPPAEINLAQSVQDALMRSGDPVIGQLRVETVQNAVVLSGYVKKIRQSDVAEQITRQVTGVQSVSNRIIVRH